jgi:cytochrome P450
MADATKARGIADMATVTAAMTAIDPDAVVRARELTSWSDVKHVLRSKDFEPPARDAGFGMDLQARSIGDTMVDLRGDEHSERRRLESVLFRSEHLRRLEEEMVVPGIRHELAKIAAAKGPDGIARADLSSLAETILLNLMARMIGLEGIVGDDEGLERFRRYTVQLERATRVKYTTGDVDAALEAGLAAKQSILEEFFEPAWEKRKRLFAEVQAGRADESELPQDLLTVMLRHHEHYERWDDQVFGRNVALFIVGSVGTTSNAVCNTVEDIESWIEAHPEDEDKRLDEPFLSRALNEAVRLRASVWIVRQAVRDTVLPSGEEVPADQVLWLNFSEAYTELYGDEANVFNPYRDQSDAAMPWGLGFGDGRHQCIGKMLVVGEGFDEGGRRGTGRIMLLELYKAGLRIDREAEPAFVPIVRQKYASKPVLFLNL